PDAARRVNYAYHTETGLTETVTLPGGAVEQFGYDVRGNMNAVTDPLLVTTQILSDALGRPIRTLAPVQVGQQSLWQRDSTVYDVMDQVRETIATGPAMNGAPQQWLHVRNHYDDEGNLEEVERWSVPDAANVDTIRTRWEYDLAGRRIVEIAADSTPGTWADNPRDSTFYDAAGNVVRVRTRRYAESLAANPGDPAAAYIRMEYDGLNRMYRRIIPAVRYSARHEGMVQRSHLGMAFHPYPYYPNDGGTGLLIPADTSLFEFDPVTGLMDHAVNGNARVRRDYFRNGQMSGDTLWTRTVAGGALDDTHRYGLEYRYDRNGRITELRHPSQLLPPLAAGRGEQGTRYGYDAVTGALKTVRDPMGNEFQYQYTLRGEPESLTLPGGITHLYTYNTGGQLERHRIQNAATGGNRYASTMLRDETLGYDWRGKLVSARNLHGLRDTLTVAYTGLGQLAGSTHKYWGWFLDTNQSTSYLATESPVHDALGNMVSINRTGALQVYGSGLLEAAQGRRNYTNGAFGYQPETGRLMERAEPGQFEFTTYDAAGNTVFTTAAPPGMQDGELLDRAAFYDGGGRLWATDVRRVESAIARMTPKYFTFEEYRLDALGRRVLVHARKHCDDVGDERICSLSSVRRTIWDDDQELYEIQMPEAQGENDTGLVNGEPRYDNGFDPNPFWGRVAYTFGGGIDRPLSIVRMGYSNQHTQQGLVRWEEFAIMPHWNAHGRAQSGTYHDGTRERCRGSYNDWFAYLNWCVQIQWADGMFPYNPAPNASESWHGTLLTEKRDASGLLYRRNRYYDPATGRFTQEDPIGLAGGVNAYGFADGDPVGYSDPYGLCSVPTALGGVA
ncbi:MAG TPA: RHS repeat-associated core domain-containing protein, partial [Longimicrobium sp.]|nr:RHS repeat-associated core domain-containing protein [Longimicrobium sp.]